MSTCQHCGLDIPATSTGEAGFCCQGCQAAYEMVSGLGLERYYRQRQLDPAGASLRPGEDDTPRNYVAYVREAGEGVSVLHLMVGGLQCAACVWLIENVLARAPGVRSARLNMTTRRLVLKWRTGEATADDLVARITALGYRLAPYDPLILEQETVSRQKSLLRAISVSGFAAGNVMLLSVSVWSGIGDDMGPSTRSLMHWLSALIALPATAYAGQYFFNSAWAALRHGRTNMNVPISVALILTAGMSLLETIRGTEHVYFDSVLALLFFLLIGRYLDLRARGRARAVGEHLLALSASAVTVIDDDGRRKILTPDQVKTGMMVFTVAGERIAVDGDVVEGDSEVDRSLISGETMPVAVGVGKAVQAGVLNLSGPLKIRVTACGEDTTLAGIVRLMEDSEQSRSRHVMLADRIAGMYSPVVHVMAALTFVGWMIFSDIGWQQALLYAVAVLIITCPCALALAVPTVQVVTSGRLFRQGVLLKSGSAIERLAGVDKVVFDKTGTLTRGYPELIGEQVNSQDLAQAVALAAASNHPLSKALTRALPAQAAASGVEEVPGCGLRLMTPQGEIRLGRRDWCGVDTAPVADNPELWLSRPGHDPRRFVFTDTLRADAAATVSALTAQGLAPELLSGDTASVVERTAAAADLKTWRAGVLPADKVARLQDLKAHGHHALMVGDGLNDAPALAAAWVSMSPSSAADVAQNAADVIFQGDRLAPVADTLALARRAESVIKENIGLSILYNVVTIPLAMAGYVTPLVAAVAMSSSSLVVILNSLRLNR